MPVEKSLSQLAPMQKAVALTFGDVGLIRSLGEAGIPVIAAGTHRDRPAYKSRYVSEIMMLPPYQSPQFIETLLRVGERFAQKPVLFTDNDQAVLAFSRHRAELANFYRFLLPDNTLIEDLLDKRRFVKLAEELALPTPRTFLPGTQEELQQVARSIQYPCILKPAYQELWRDERIVHGILDGRYKKALKLYSPEELSSAYQRIRQFSPELIVQEYVHGSDDQLYSLNAYLNPAGVLRAFFLGRKLRTCPAEFGMGSCVESAIDPEIIEIGTQIVKRMGYLGLANVQFKRDDRSHELKLLEINPRFNLWGYLGTRCGVNFPAQMYRDLTGSLAEEKPQAAYPAGVRWIFFKNDVKAFLEYRRRGEWSWGRWIRSYRGRFTFHLFSWNDPLPALYGFWLFIRAQLSRRAPRGT